MKREKSIVREARVEFRATPSFKIEIEEAVALLGTTFSAFATDTLLQRARQVKEEFQSETLSKQEQLAFTQLLSAPPAPSDSLVRLMRARVDL